MTVNLPATIPVGNAKLPQRYQEAKDALQSCEEIDECQDWADKAAALASYARQAQDDALERMAMRIKTRAIKRAGELLKRLPEHLGGRPSSKPMPAPTQVSRSEAAKKAGLSERQKVTALRVASVPDDEFEEAVESEKPPTVTALAERGKKKRKPSLPKNPAPIQKLSRPTQELLAELKGTLSDTIAAWPTEESLAPAIQLLEKELKHYKVMSKLRRGG